MQFTALSIAAATIGFSSSILQEGTRQSRHHRERTLPRCLFGWRLVIAFPVSVLVSWLNAPSKGAFFNLRSAGRYHAKFSLGKNRRGACRDPDAGTQETLPTAFNSRLLTDWHDRGGCGRTGMLPGGAFQAPLIYSASLVSLPHLSKPRSTLLLVICAIGKVTWGGGRLSESERIERG